MLKTKNILDESNKLLRTISKDVVFPLDEKDLQTIDTMLEYLKNSQIDELAEKYDLRPGMGMSAIQLGIPKRYFVVVQEQVEKGTFKNFIIVNPKILTKSEEQIYVEDGEGCLSINRPTYGIVPRSARVTIEGYDLSGKKITIRAREDLSICFQHEIDHLNGILFTDHIDKKNPYKNAEKYRAL